MKSAQYKNQFGMKRSKYIRYASSYAALIPLALFALLPFVLLLLASLKSLEEYYSLNYTFFPKMWLFSNYAGIFGEAMLFRWIGNTLLLTVSVTGICTLATLIVSYGFAKFICKANNVLFMVLLSTMMIPWMVTMIPSFSIWAQLGLVNTYWPLILPNIGGSAFYIFLFRQSMKGIPNEMSEAATIDGCNSFKILFRIILPNIIPTIMTMIIFTVMGQWGDFMGPFLYLSDVRKFTLSLGINMMTPQHGGYTPWPMLLAASTMFALPVIALYFFGTKVFKKGLIVSSLK